MQGLVCGWAGRGTSCPVPLAPTCTTATPEPLHLHETLYCLYRLRPPACLQVQPHQDHQDLLHRHHEHAGAGQALPRPLPHLLHLGSVRRPAAAPAGGGGRVGGLGRCRGQGSVGDGAGGREEASGRAGARQAVPGSRRWRRRHTGMPGPSSRCPCRRHPAVPPRPRLTAPHRTAQTEEYWGNVNPIGERSCYDEGKRAAECLTMDYHREHGQEVGGCLGPWLCVCSGGDVCVVGVAAWAHRGVKASCRGCCRVREQRAAPGLCQPPSPALLLSCTLPAHLTSCPWLCTHPTPHTHHTTHTTHAHAPPSTRPHAGAHRAHLQHLWAPHGARRRTRGVQLCVAGGVGGGCWRGCLPLGTAGCGSGSTPRKGCGAGRGWRRCSDGPPCQPQQAASLSGTRHHTNHPTPAAPCPPASHPSRL